MYKLFPVHKLKKKKKKAKLEDLEEGGQQREGTSGGLDDGGGWNQKERKEKLSASALVTNKLASAVVSAITDWPTCLSSFVSVADAGLPLLSAIANRKRSDSPGID